MNTDFVEFMFWSFNKFHKVEAIHSFQMTGECIFQRASRIECADGFNVSIQAGCANYCQPRQSFFEPDMDQGNFFENYTSFELGFPNMHDDLLAPYAEDESDPCNTVYGYVPKEIITAVIEKHGGLVNVVDGEVLGSKYLEEK